MPALPILQFVNMESILWLESQIGVQAQLLHVVTTVHTRPKMECYNLIFVSAINHQYQIRNTGSAYFSRTKSEN